VRQDELRVEEARASLAAAIARANEANAAEHRGAVLHTRGYIADVTYERAQHAREIAGQDTIRRAQAAGGAEGGIRLEAAVRGTYLGDNYNDIPSSFQRARELTLRIEGLRRLSISWRKSGRHSLPNSRLGRNAWPGAAARRSRRRSTAICGLAAPGEFVRKGQELFTVVDCSSVVVTASISERDYNELRLDDPVRFRVSGTNREYNIIGKLGLTSTGRSFAIAPEERHHQVAVQLAALETSDSDRCAVGAHRRSGLRRTWAMASRRVPLKVCAICLESLEAA